jgi:SNF2 family DNA or RNA helicase
MLPVKAMTNNIQFNIDEEDVVVSVDGLELLKLKAKLTQILGSSVVAGKGNVRFPRACLPRVKSLFDIDTVPSTVKRDFELFDAHEHARENIKKILDGFESTSVSDKWTSILEPQQVTAVECMVEEGLLGLCLFDEQGSGKTVMTIAAFDTLRDRCDIDVMIVVCPKSMMTEWPKDILRFLGTDTAVEVALGDRRSKFNSSLKNFDVLVSNYEGLEPMLVPLASLACTKNILLVIDESYYAKNEQSRRSELLSKLRSSCRRCFVLCGTPAPNSAHDLINQFDLADLGYTFGDFKKSKDPLIDWDAINLLIENRGTYIRRLKADILKFVPEKCFQLITVPLLGKQQLLYDRARDALYLELRNLNNDKFLKQIATYFQKRATLLQICCSPSSIDPTITNVPVKFTVLDELLERLIGQGRKVIVWSFFRKNIDELMQRYAHHRPVRVDGSVPSEERRQAVSAFQTDPDVMLFVGNPAAAGAGITLHAAHDAVYMSYSNQAAHYLQSLDRIHRRGQTAAEVHYYLLVCEGTIEETEVKRLRGKEVRQHDLLGDQVKWPTSLDEALDELGPIND